MSSGAQFTLIIRGEIQSGLFPEHLETCMVKYSFLTPNSQAWNLVSGERMHASPLCRPRHDTAVWNAPLDCAFTSATPVGWPRLCLTVMGSDWFGREYVVGYGVMLVPSQPGRHERSVRLVVPAETSLFGKIFGYISGRRPSLIDADDFLTNQKPHREMVRMRNTGASVNVSFNILIRDYEELNLVFS